MLNANRTISLWYMELLIHPNVNVFSKRMARPADGSDVYAANELEVLMFYMCTVLHCWPHDWDIVFCI